MREPPRPYSNCNRVGVSHFIGTRGITVATDSDYSDEPATRTLLDPFGRPEFVYATPTGGSEILVAKSSYDNGTGPLRVEHFEYVDEAAGQSIYSAEIFGLFGGVWKTIAATPSGYAGTITYWDPVARRARTTLPLDCDGDPTCDGFEDGTEEGAEAVAREVLTDAVGRPVRIESPEGASILTYRSVGNRWGGSGQLDAVLEKNGKGDLLERALDGDRTAWVDECHGEAPPSVACGAADTTRYTYEATGEIRSIYDARAVAGASFSDPNHRLRYSYDTLGRVVRIEDPDLEGTGVSVTTYSDAGTLASTTNARGQSRSFDHDILGRLVAVTTPEGEDDYTVTYRPSEWQREKDSSQWYERVRAYDGWGRVRQTRLSVREDDELAQWGGWSGTYLMDFAYDLAGRPVEIVYPESTRVRYEYEGAFLERVCDLGTAADCSDGGVVQYVSDVTYDGLGRRKVTASAAGTRTFSYDGSLPRLSQDRFVGSASPDPYWFELSYDDYDELGNLTEMTGSSQPGDIDLNQSFGYDSRGRLATWTHQGVAHAYGHDELGNLTSNAGSAQVFDDPGRPHAIQSRASGGATYGFDADGNVTSIVSPEGARYFRFDSASHLVCADTVESGCALSRLHYDVDGHRVLDDAAPNSLEFVAFVDDSVSVDGGLYFGTRIEIRAFGERIAYKRSGDDFRTAGVSGGLPWSVPPAALGLLAGLGLLGLLAWWAKQGALVLVIQRPGYAGVSAVLVVGLVLGPVPGARVSRAGGGGETSFYWELADRLGTGLVMLDETGARRVHRTYSPFGVEQASAGEAEWLPRHYAGHPEDENSGLVYMQARWMDPQSGTFLSIDPVVANAADPQAFNAYSYARNNPVGHIDPTGEFCVPIFGPCTDEGGGSWFQGPWEREPGPSAAPIDSIGHPLSGLNFGGREDRCPKGNSHRSSRSKRAGSTTSHSPAMELRPGIPLPGSDHS